MGPSSPNGHCVRRARWPPVSAKVLHGTPASRSIVGFAAQLPASLVAMATHGRTGLARTAVGSVTAEVVAQAPCPVLVCRPAAATST